MKIWVTSDTHFGHAKLIEWGRDPNFNFMELSSHRKLIEPSDYLIHLGDFCIGNDAKHTETWFENIRTDKRILVRGNHDKKSNGWYLSHGWSAVADQLVLRLFGKKVVFSHIPVDPKLWPVMDYNVHGHTHGNMHRDFEVRDFYDKSFHREVAMELTNYKPILVTDKFLEKS